MSDGFLRFGAGTDGTTTAADTIATVAAGSALLAIAGVGSSNAPATHTVSDAQGAYTELLTGSAGTSTGPANDNVNTVWLNLYLLQNANAGSHTATFTGPASASAFCLLVEISADTAAALIVAISNSQANPGAGADLITTGVLTPVAAAATLVAFLCTSSSLTAGDRATATTGTSRATGTSTSVGVWMLETYAIATDTAGTGTSTGGGTNRFCDLGVALKNGGPPPTPNDVKLINQNQLTKTFRPRPFAPGRGR